MNLNKNINPQPKPFDVVHPNLKNECSFVIDDYRPHQCVMCLLRFVYRNYLKRWRAGAIFCSWGCVVEHEDYVNWTYEMRRKGYFVNHSMWLRSDSGTKYFEMYVNTEGQEHHAENKDHHIRN